jgi:aldehyde dehydrogenase (NAD+)
MQQTSNPRWIPSERLEIPSLLTAYIDGEWVTPDGEHQLPVEDPGGSAQIATIDESNADLVDRAVQSAHDAFRVWRRTAPAQRGRIMLAIAASLRLHARDIGELETVDTGKPLSQALGDVETAARYFEYYAGLADKHRGATIPQAEGMFAYTLREPYGVIGHITPWNSPLNQMSRGVAPSLATGNTVVVKPSELTPLSTAYVARLFIDAGLPAGAYNVVLGRGSVTGSALVSHPLVKHVSFTGSVATGRTIMQLASQNIIPCNLELGGKSPTIVMADADLPSAARAGAAAVIRNSGQSCFATTRQIVHRSIHDEYIELVAAEVGKLSVGHGLDDPDLGPLASEQQLSKVRGFIDGAREDGARVVTGGTSPEAEAGHYLMPVVLDGVTADMRVAREEVFGPVQSVLTFDSEEEAIQIANDSIYGLAAGVFTTNVSTAHRVAAELEAGQVQVNGYPLGSVDTPFGGYKQSGLGREKGVEALDYYTQLKTVIMKLDPAPEP